MYCKIQILARDRSQKYYDKIVTIHLNLTLSFFVQILLIYHPHSLVFRVLFLKILADILPIGKPVEKESVFYIYIYIYIYIYMSMGSNRLKKLKLN